MFKPLSLCTFILIASLAVSSVARADDSAWSNDVAASLKKAAAENKDVLMDFTGSDWCIWCKKLHAEVFEKDVFKQNAPKNFVLVELDFPNGKKLPDAVKKQNAEWKDKFSIQGFPTVMVLDAKGRPIGQLGYQPDAAAWLKSAQEMHAHRLVRDEKWAAAEKASGKEKAKLMFEGLDALGNDELMFSAYATEVEACSALDAGLKAKFDAKQKAIEDKKKVKEEEQQREQANMAKIQPLLKDAQKDPAKTVQALEDLAAQKDSSADLKQKALYVAFRICQQGVKDNARAEKLLDASIAADPTSGPANILRSIKEKLPHQK